MLYALLTYVFILPFIAAFIWFLLGMSNWLRGFGGTDVFTLLVGQEKEVLSVPKGILTQIPHFRAALSSGDFTESQNKRFELSDDSPKAIADIIYFTHSGRVPEPNSADGYTITTYLQTWITADKYQTEVLANGMIDKIVLFHGETVVTGTSIVTLREAGLSDGLLGNLLLRVIAWDMSHSVYKPEWTFMGQALDKLSKEEMEIVLEIIMKQRKEDKDPLDVAKKEPCMLHTHALTPVCTAENL